MNNFDKLLEDVSYLRGKVDATFESIDNNNKVVNKILSDHSLKISTLENEQGKINVKVGFIGAVFGAVGTFVTQIILRKF